MDKEKYKLLHNLDLAEYFITSKAERIESKVEKIEVKKAVGTKCKKCWKILEKKCEREGCPV